MSASLQLNDQRRHALDQTTPLGENKQTQGADNLQTQGARINHGGTVIEKQTSIDFQRAGNSARLARIKASTRPLKIVCTRFQPAGLNRLPDTLRIHEFLPCRALGQHGRCDLDFGKEHGQQVQRIQPTQGDQRPGIGDDDPS